MGPILYEVLYENILVIDIEYILKNHETFSNSPAMKVYINKFENIIISNINTRYLEIFNACNLDVLTISKITWKY